MWQDAPVWIGASLLGTWELFRVERGSCENMWSECR